MRLLRTIFAVVLLGLAAAAAPQSFPERNRAAVVDAAEVIPAPAEAELDAAILGWNRDTGHQFAIATVPSLQGQEIQDYANRLFRRWGLGTAATEGLIFRPVSAICPLVRGGGSCLAAPFSF
jgi:uncharacterized protein